jgi:hypothetical protein
MTARDDVSFEVSENLGSLKGGRVQESRLLFSEACVRNSDIGANRGIVVSGKARTLFCALPIGSETKMTLMSDKTG